MDYSMYQKNLYSVDVLSLKHFIHTYNSNYALATMLFPKRIREATLILYSFVRYADELVDNPEKKIPGQTHAGIDEFVIEFNQVVSDGFVSNTNHPIIRANYFLFIEYNIPFNYLHDFLKVMADDRVLDKYHSYAELEHYMWGSATVVGHIMTYIIGYTDPSAFDHARALAEGMQLANFLRDINEDYQDRKRIYLPIQDQKVFGVNLESIKTQQMTPQLYNLINFYRKRAEGLFEKGIRGITLLNRSGRFPVLLAAYVYRYNLRILRVRKCNVFTTPIRISPWRKGLITVHALWDYFLHYYGR